MWLREETQQKGLDGDGFADAWSACHDAHRAIASLLGMHQHFTGRPKLSDACRHNRLLSWWEPILIKQETPLGIGVHSVLLLCCSCFPVSNGKRPADKLASHHRNIFTLERGGNEPLIAPLSHTLVLLRVRRTSRTTRSETTTERIANPTAVSSAL